MSTSKQCSRCGKRFTRSSSMYRHTRSIHGNARRNIRCLHCSEHFARVDNLTRHRQRQHGATTSVPPAGPSTIDAPSSDDIDVMDEVQPDVNDQPSFTAPLTGDEMIDYILQQTSSEGDFPFNLDGDTVHDSTHSDSNDVNTARELYPSSSDTQHCGTQDHEWQNELCQKPVQCTPTQLASSSSTSAANDAGYFENDTILWHGQEAVQQSGSDETIPRNTSAFTVWSVQSISEMVLDNSMDRNTHSTSNDYDVEQKRALYAACEQAIRDFFG